MATPNVARKKGTRRASGPEENATASAKAEPVRNESSKSAAKVASLTTRESKGFQGYLDNITRFLKSVRTEVDRVAWPSFKELRAATIVVVVTLLLVSGYMGVVDWLLTLVFGTPVATGF